MSLSPIETQIENLIKLGTLKPAIRDRAEIQQYLDNARQVLADISLTKVEGKQTQPALSIYSRYTMAYEALHGLAIVNLLNFGVRPGDAKGHRATTFDKFFDWVLPEPAHLPLRKAIKQAHERRNETTYRSAIPPVSSNEAKVLGDILALLLPVITHMVTQQDAKLAAS